MADENAFNSWRQLNRRFEREEEAQQSTVLLELHNIPAATTIEETKMQILQLKVRIARAEDILGTRIQKMQRETALLQVIDLIT